MPRLFPLLLLCLTLLTAACKKDKAEPEVPLEGRWTFESGTEFFYKPDGTLTKTEEAVFIPSYLIISADAMTYYATLNNAIIIQYTYTRQDKALHLTAPSKADVELVELTEHRLVMRSDKVPKGTPDGYVTQQVVYTR
jgi:hypothetical protein